jgi:hypothetical protein
MATNKSNSKAAALARVQALIAGTQKHLASGSFTLAGVSFTAATIVPLLQSVADAINAVNAIQASAKDTVAASAATEAKVAPIISDFQRFVQLTFANATPTLADFGLAPRKARTPLTPAQLAARSAKAAATRQARGTTSKKQKLTVKGNVTGVTLTPVTAPTAAPSPSAQPASTAPAAAPTGTAMK